MQLLVMFWSFMCQSKPISYDLRYAHIIFHILYEIKKNALRLEKRPMKFCVQNTATHITVK